MSATTRTVIHLATLGFALLAGLPAQASSIQMDTRYYAGKVLGSAAAYKSTIDALVTAAPTSGYGDASLAGFNSVSNHAQFGSSTNIAFRYEVDFSANSAGTWNFRIGPDFGLGGAVFLDGITEAFKTNDMWWNGSYGTASQNLSFSANLAAGNHSLLIYGLEACCDGSQQAQFKAPGALVFTSFSTQDGHAPVAADIGHVPEPGSLPLACTALLGLLAGQRKWAA